MMAGMTMAPQPPHAMGMGGMMAGMQQPQTSAKPQGHAAALASMGAAGLPPIGGGVQSLNPLAGSGIVGDVSFLGGTPTPPPQQPQPAAAGGGGGTDLEQLLASCSLTKLLPKLLENDIDSVAELKLCTEDDYKEMDISIGMRRKLMEACGQAPKSAPPPPPPPQQPQMSGSSAANAAFPLDGSGPVQSSAFGFMSGGGGGGDAGGGMPDLSAGSAAMQAAEAAAANAAMLSNSGQMGASAFSFMEGGNTAAIPNYMPSSAGAAPSDEPADAKAARKAARQAARKEKKGEKQSEKGPMHQPILPGMGGGGGAFTGLS